jgi:hypothetical protein
MASRVEFAVSATPIYTASNAEMSDTDVVAKDVGRTVGGSGSVTVTWGSTTGYTAGVPSYKEGYLGTLTCTSAKFLYIKHTGYTLVGGDGGTLGVPTTETLILNDSNATPLAELGAGDAMIFPCKNAHNLAFTFLSHDNGSIAIEYFWTA